MTDNFADRLLEAVEAKGSPVCVGLDPRVEHLPEDFQLDCRGQTAQAEAVRLWGRELLEVVAPIVPAVKPQSAYFEKLGAPGVAAYIHLVGYAKKLGLLVLGDVKRNDIGSTAEAYADAHLSGPGGADAVTVNGYLGADGIEPFLKVCRAEGKGVFVLVRTSNPSAPAVQDFADASGKKLYEHVAEMVAALGDGTGLVGSRGYSSVGAVVGATWPDEARKLRRLMPRQIFLVPGYGAQGASASDCAASFQADGAGAIVNASRSVIFAHRDKQYAGMDWKQAVGRAARAFAVDIARAVGKA
ncbi:MAG TPA: orotidine-5'-phosphate decarboxylase [Phycisphaerales bacterium]|nr:orotidine-5'-phosphate decarboxylase [Phycisphaerales bacterium]